MAAFLVAALAAPSALAEDVAAAGRAFEAGQAAQLRGNHGEAAGFFELANNLVASPAALRSAIRNHAAAGNRARAATLATLALALYAADAAVRQVADEALMIVDELGTLVIRCTRDEPGSQLPFAVICAVAMDDLGIDTDVESERTLFVEPGAHVLVATFADGGQAHGQVEVAAGERVETELAEPVGEGAAEESAEVEGRELESEAESQVDSESDSDSATDNESAAETEDRVTEGGLPLWVPLLGFGATALVGGITMWSGLDTLSARDAYVEMPTEAGYDDGVVRQTRTNVLLGITIGLAIVSAVLLIFADMGMEEELRASISAGPEGGAVTVTGAF